MRAAVAQFFFERFAHAIDVAVLAEDQREDEPVIACAYLAVGAVIAHEGAAGPGRGVGKREGDGMALCSVSAGAMAGVARGEQAAASDGLGSFAYNHAVHDDEVARL